MTAAAFDHLGLSPLPEAEGSGGTNSLLTYHSYGALWRFRKVIES